MYMIIIKELLLTKIYFISDLNTIACMHLNQTKLVDLEVESDLTTDLQCVIHIFDSVVINMCT